MAPSVYLLLAIAFLAATAQRQAEVVWSVGRPDGSYSELALASRYQQFASVFSEHILFRPGQDRARQAWPYVQPGPADRWAGSRPHRFEVRFQLVEQPTGWYELHLRFLDAHPRLPPVLRVEVNGQNTKLVLRPGRGLALTDPRAIQLQKRVIPIDAGLLRRGENRLVLTSVRGSWAVYDSVQLMHYGQEPVDALCGLRLIPTVLYVRRGGRLMRLVRVVPEGAPLFRAGKLTAETTGGWSERLSFSPDPFGRQVLELLLPDVDQPTTVRLSLTVGNRQVQSVASLRPARKWLIFLAPASHVDIGYTALQDEAVEAHCRNIDAAVTLAGRYPFFKWNTESAWVLRRYLATRPAERVVRMARLHAAGKLAVGSLHSNLLTGLCSGETLFRAMYLGRQFERCYGIPRQSVMLTDAPSHVWQLPTVLAECGIRYLSMGINQIRAPLLRHGRLHERSPTWWQGPDGRRVLAMFHQHYAQAGLIGAHGDVALMEATVPLLIERFRRRGDAYPYDAIHLHGAYGDNQVIRERMVQAVAAWNSRYAYPRVIFSRNDEFFRYIEEHYADRLPIVRGDGGSYWEDGAASSARETKLNRANERLAAAVELIWTLLAAVDKRIRYPREQLNQAWDNILLYNEHTWGAHNSITEPESPFVRKQFERKAGYAHEAHRILRGLLDCGLTTLGSLIGTGGQKRLLVLNPSSAEVVDATVWAGGRQWPVTLPPFSYALIEVEPPLREGPSRQPLPLATVLETDKYRLVLDPSRVAIRQLVDRELGEALVDESAPWQLGQYIYATGGENTKAVIDTSPTPARFQFHSPTDGKLVACWRESEYVVAVMRGTTLRTPRLELEIRLHTTRKVVELRWRFRKEKTYAKEAVYLAFPFAARNPEIAYRVGGAAVTAGRDWLPGACKDWFCVQDWLRVRQGRPAMDIVLCSPDAPLVQLQGIQTGKWLKRLPLQNGTVMGYVLNNYWFTNYRAGQGGEFHFRYVITSGNRISDARATAVAALASDPLAARLVQSDRRGSLPRSGTIVAVEPREAVVVQAVKWAEEGRAVIVRLQSFFDRRLTARLKLPLLPVQTAWRASGVEIPLERLQLEHDTILVPMAPRTVVTVRCSLK